MANMGSITKFIQAFKTHFNRNRSRTTDEDEAQESPKELEGDASDQNPGDVRMNSGVHKRVYGVRRKIVGFTVIGLLLAFTMSYVFFQDDPGSKAPRRPNGSSVQETKTPSHAGETAAKDELSYRDLRALDQRNQGARVASAQPMDSDDDPHVATRVNRGDTDVSPQTYSVAASPGGGVYSAPVSTPVPAPVASAANAALAAEKRAADELEKRFASAIDFALGRSGNSNAGGEAAVSGGAAQPSGEAPVIPASNTLQTANLSLTSGSPYVVQAGTLIPAMLFTGIDTAVPGQVTAQVSADVYDSLTIEDTKELKCTAENYVALSTTDTVDMDNLLRKTLRLSPNRIVVGEVRGKEALTLVDAWSTGHRGGCSTVHSDSAHDTLFRLEDLVSRVSISSQQAGIARAIDVIVYIERRAASRVIAEVLSIDGWDRNAHDYITHRLDQGKE